MAIVREKRHRLPKEAYRGEVLVSVTIGVKNRAPLFTDPVVVAAFVHILEGVVQRGGCAVPVYCFMPDHLHLLLWGREPAADLWRVIADFKQRAGYWLYRNRPSFSLQKDYYDHIIRKSEDLLAHIRYILDNPVRKGLVTNWEDYPFQGTLGCSLEEVAGL